MHTLTAHRGEHPIRKVDVPLFTGKLLHPNRIIAATLSETTAGPARGSRLGRGREDPSLSSWIYWGKIYEDIQYFAPPET